MGHAVSDHIKSVPSTGVHQLPRREGASLPPPARLSVGGCGSASWEWLRRSALKADWAPPPAITGRLPAVVAVGQPGSDSLGPSPEMHRRANISMERTGDSGWPLNRSVGSTLALAEHTWRAKDLHTASRQKLG